VSLQRDEAIDVITAAIAVSVMLFLLHVPAHAKAMEKQDSSYYEDFILGIKYVRNHVFVKKFFLFFGVFTFLAAPVAFLTPLQVTRTFGADVWRLTAIEIAFSAGMMLGGIIMASWGGFKNRIYTMTISGIVIGAGTLALGLVPIFWIYLAVMGLVGFVMPVFNTPATVLLQEKVESDYLGRVFGVMSMISSTTMPLGMLLFGPLSDIVRIEWLLIIKGALILLECLFLYKDKSLRKAGLARDAHDEAILSD
jgi:DHA3 family macrolide efflux protein-like MFS transporter